MNKLESALTIIIILILSILIADISPYDDFNEKLNKEYIDKINTLENEIHALQEDIEKANEILVYQKEIMMSKHFWFIIENKKLLGGDR